MVERPTDRVDFSEIGSPEERLSFLVSSIQEAETLRVAGYRGGEYDDSYYYQAGQRAGNAAARFELLNVPESQWEEMDSKELSGLAHICLLISSIGLSRVTHTMNDRSVKEVGLESYAKFLSRAEEIATVLADRGFLETIDGNKFLWPVEVERNWARFYQSVADLREPDTCLRLAKDKYDAASRKAVELIASPNRAVSFSAKMAHGTTIVESAMVGLKLDQHSPDTFSLREKFTTALVFMDSSWTDGCKEWDRFDAGLNRMTGVLEDRDGLEDLRGTVIRRRIDFLEEIIEYWEGEGPDLVAKSRLADMREKHPSFFN